MTSSAADDIAVYLAAYGDDDAVRTYANTWASAEQIRKAAETPLTIPVMAVAGERSLGQNMIDFVGRPASGAEGIILPGCGHLIPDELAELVTAFLASARG
jgi:pimeloyl-ACP methyl ester carboxylesterase